MKITAKVVPFSSVVGGGVMLLNSKGRCVGQLAFICHDDTLRDKPLQVSLSEAIVAAINAVQP
jgi:hypothetical protein